MYRVIKRMFRYIMRFFFTKFNKKMNVKITPVLREPAYFANDRNRPSFRWDTPDILR